MVTQRTLISLVVLIMMSVFAVTIPATATSLAAPRAPGHCEAELTIGFGQRFILVEWRDRSNDEDGFTIEHWMKLNGVWQVVGSQNAAANQSNIAFWPDFGEHRFRVRAFNADGASSWSNWARLRI